MKSKLILTFTLVFMSSTAFAENREVVLSERTISVGVDISTTKLKLSRADYSSPVVKVLVPELADITILDHRNTGEGAPCMATYDTLWPEDVIQDNPAVEIIPMKITLKKGLVPDVENSQCEVFLTEHIEANIRGFAFNHTKSMSVGFRHIEDCR